MALKYPFSSKVVGISNYQQIALACNLGDRVEISHEPENPYDPNACVVKINQEVVGYLPKVLARRLVEAGEHRWVGVISVKHDQKATVGIEVRIEGVRNAEKSEMINQVVVPKAATAQGRRGRIVVVKRSGRELGELVSVNRELRQVIVSTKNGEISYPDGLVNILEPEQGEHL
jgi:hypothetical protein